MFMIASPYVTEIGAVMSFTELRSDARIVVGVDGSQHAERALEWAAREARLRSLPLEIVGVALQHRVPVPLDRSADAVARMLERIVGEHAVLLEPIDWRSSVVEAASGTAADALIGTARDADLLVVGSRGLGGFPELLFGSVSHQVVVAGPCPIAIVRGSAPPADDGLREIVVGAADDEISLTALRWAFAESLRRGVTVTVVHGLDFPDDATLLRFGLSPERLGVEHERMRSSAADRVDALIDKAMPTQGDVAVDRVVLRGAPAGALLRRAGVERLLVVGSRGSHARHPLALGSVSHQCVHHARGPIVVVPTMDEASLA